MWSSKLFRRVFVAFAGSIVIAAVAFAMLVSRGHEAELRAQLVEQLRVSTVLFGEMATDAFSQSDPVDARAAARFQSDVQRLGKQIGTRLTLVTATGRVLADSNQDSLDAVRRMESHGHRPEIKNALTDGTGFVQRYSSTDEEPQFYYATRVERDGTPVGVARASLPVHTIQEQVYQGKQRVWMFAVIVAAIAMVGTGYLLTRITQPLMALNRAVERMSAGHLGEQVEIASRDEIGMLAKAFNDLSDDLLERIDQLRKHGDQLAAVLGGMVEGVIAVDRQTRVMFANDAAGRQFDFKANDARGRPLLTLIRNEALHQSVQRALETGDVVNVEVKCYLPSTGALAIHAKPLPGSPCPGVVLVLHDVTRVRRLESLRQEFVANVSHELKTPLSSIKAYAETLRAGAINDQEHNVEFVTRIEAQADRLHQLIMDLLSLARIESTEEAFEIGDVDILETVETCLQEQRPGAVAKSIEMCVEPSEDALLVRADEEAVRQILENLVNNAIKYTPAQGRITIRWKRQRGSALIEVADTGVGIEPVHLDRLFERFYRVDKARSRELGGTGLGLSIVKHLTQFFGGRVGVQSEVGEGTTFWVSLPLSK